MNISGPNIQFAAHVEKAYNIFVRDGRPFSVLKLNIPKQIIDKKEINDVIYKNFRGTRDLVSKGNDTFSILMQNTTIEAAMKASTRLAAKLYQLNYSRKEPTDNQILHAPLDIMGCGKDTNEVEFTHIDLNQAASREKRSNNTSCKFNSYLNQSGLLLTAGKTSHVINIRV